MPQPAPLLKDPNPTDPNPTDPNRNGPNREGANRNDSCSASLTSFSSRDIRFHIDLPSTEQEVCNAVEVAGWAYCATDPISRVEAAIGESTPVVLTQCEQRPDVAAAFENPEMESCGFRGTVYLNDIACTGYCVLQVRVITESGECVTEKIPLTLTASLCVDHVSYFEHLLVVEGRVVTENAEPSGILRFSCDGSFWGAAQIDSAGDEPQVGAGSYSRPFRFTRPLPSEEFDSNRRLELACSIDAGLELRAAVPLQETVQQPSAGYILTSIFQNCAKPAQPSPAVLDCWTGISDRIVADLQPFKPPVKSINLPYLSDSIDIVLCPPEMFEEAFRVASSAVILVRQEPTSNTADGKVLEIVWKHEPTTCLSSTSVSVIIPVFNQIAYTLDCLEQIHITLPEKFSGEIIVVDDCSTDDTLEALQRAASRYPWLRCISNESNQGFVRSCNAGAQHARGELLVFLNNDTLPLPGWLEALTRTFKTFPDAGVVGGKLLYPDGRLQEAGGMVFDNGSAANVGRRECDADTPLFNYVRDVDYCSGALLATPRSLFLELGGFDSSYEPAYYEDSDYCFAVRERGRRVLYQPESAVIHCEGVSSGVSATQGTKRYLLVNRETFFRKWQHRLRYHQKPIPKRKAASYWLSALARRRYR